MEQLIADPLIDRCREILDFLMKQPSVSAEWKRPVLEYCSHWWLSERDHDKLNPYVMQILRILTMSYTGLKQLPQKVPSSSDFQKLESAYNNGQTNVWLTLVNSTAFKLDDVPESLRLHIKIKELHLQ